MHVRRAVCCQYRWVLNPRLVEGNAPSNLNDLPGVALGILAQGAKAGLDLGRRIQLSESKDGKTDEKTNKYVSTYRHYTWHPFPKGLETRRPGSVLDHDGALCL
jgi:hypothetical protein